MEQTRKKDCPAGGDSARGDRRNSDPQGGNRYPTLTVTWDKAAFKMSVQECSKKLRDGSPRIEVLTGNNPSTVPGVHEGDPKTPRPPRPDDLRIISMTLQAGEDVLVGRRLREVLNGARKAV